MKKFLKSKQAQYIGLTLFFFLLFVLLVLGYREAIKMSTNNSPSNGTSYPVSLPESVSERPTLVPTVKPTIEPDDEITKKELIRRSDTKGIIFKDYEEYIKSEAESVPEEYYHENLNIDFMKSTKKLSSPEDWSECKVNKLGVTIYVPKLSECKEFEDGTTYIYISSETKTEEFEPYEIQVNFEKYSTKLGNKVFPRELINFDELKTTKIQGLKAVKYIQYGAEGSLWRTLDVKINENTILTFIVQVRPFYPKDTQEEIFKSHVINQILHKITGSFSYENI